MEQQSVPLPGLAPSHIYAIAHYDWRSGWSGTVTVTGLSSLRARAASYDGLSSPELLDVLCAELERLLAPPNPLG